ncbi:MAG: type VI secretion system protein TssA [Chloroflexota bacterium]
MKTKIDVDAILAPIPGENPTGEDLRYSQTYEDIKEARRADDLLDRGAWQTEVKTSDWEKVQKLAAEALTKRTKDLQIAAWLTEALIATEGFEGLLAGLKIVTRFLTDYWDTVYPLIEEGDLDYRAAPLEFMNEKLWSAVKGIPVTDRKTTPGYSWLKWEESRGVGYEKDTRNQWGDVDDGKKRKRDEQISDGKITAEEFDSAVALSSKGFYEALAPIVTSCREEFKRLDQAVDEKFGVQHAPRLADIGSALEECEKLVLRFLKDKGGAEPAALQAKEVPAAEEAPQVGALEAEAMVFQPSPQTVARATPPVVTVPLARVPEGADIQDDALWQEALNLLGHAGMHQALGMLLQAGNQAPSLRQRSRCRLLVAKLCLKAERPDLARPIIEELHALIEELHLDRWESPLWIAEVVDTLYQCLTQGEPSDEDTARARALFERLCRTDVTKAAAYKG